MNIYEKFGLEPIINLSGSVTRLGGAPMPVEVLAAFQEAAGWTVPLEALQAAASRKIAAITKTEAGLVTAGSAAALTLGAAAIITRYDLGKMERLPHCDGFPHEFLIAREQRSGYDHAVRAAGARLVEVGFNEIVSNAGVRRTEAWEYEAAITSQTAGILYVLAPTSRPHLPELVEVARRHNLPILVDAAGEVYPRTNLSAIAATGVDLVSFSGGKAIRGPQSTGILCGKKDLIGPAALQMLDMDDHPELWDPPADLIDRSKLAGMPRHGFGRSLKVSKEEIIALLTALELYASGNYDTDLATFRRNLVVVAEALRNTACVTKLVEDPGGERPPVLEITIDEGSLGRSAFEVCKRLRNGKPGIYPGHGKLPEGKLVLQPLCLNSEQVETLAKRLREELTP